MTMDELAALLKVPGFYVIRTDTGQLAYVMAFEVSDDLKCYQLDINNGFARDGVLQPDGWNTFAVKNSTVRGPFANKRNFKHAVRTL